MCLIECVVLFAADLAMYNANVLVRRVSCLCVWHLDTKSVVKLKEVQSVITVYLIACSIDLLYPQFICRIFFRTFYSKIGSHCVVFHYINIFN